MNKRQKLTSYSRAKRLRTGNLTPASASAVPSHNQSGPSNVWKRYGEGFQLEDDGRGNKSGLLLGHCQRYQKESSSFSETSADHTVTETKCQRNFGETWIQLEELFPVLENKNGRRNFTSESTSTAAKSDHLLKDIICWSDSESDKEDIKKQQNSYSAPIKKPFVNKSMRKGQWKRKAENVKNCELEVNSDSHSINNISSESSGDEENKFAEDKESHLSSFDASPLLQIQCEKSPQHLSSSSSVESILSDSLDYADSPDLHCKQKEKTESETPTISSNSSSQAVVDSDTSPGQGGLRASDWVKQVKWETTPSKQKEASPPDKGDSAKKKKKFVKGGLAERMSKIVLREKSSSRMWQHHHIPDQTSQGMMVIIRNLETVYSLQLADCKVVSHALSQQPSVNTQCFVLFSSYCVQRKDDLQPGVTLDIYPPWLQLETHGGRKVLLCMRYIVKQLTSEPSLYCMETTGSSCSSSLEQAGSGKWMCPCFTDKDLASTNCPAYLFPFFPASLVKHASIRDQKETLHDVKTLQTVIYNEGYLKRSLVFRTLLESLEKAHSGNRILPSFQATVLQVFYEQEINSHRSLLLVEDSQGTVALISGTKQAGDVEGYLCTFFCLRVQSRTNVDRDPALFSAITAAWSSKIKSADASQESHSNDSSVNSQIFSHPPGFCYLLDVDSCACDALGGEDCVRISSSRVQLAPKYVFQTLAEVLQISGCNNRISGLYKVIYHLTKSSTQVATDGDRSVNSFEMCICDHSLQKASAFRLANFSRQLSAEKCPEKKQEITGDTNLPSYVKLQVRFDCVQGSIRHDNRRPLIFSYLILLKNIWIYNGVWIADKYSSLIPLEENNKDTAAGRSLVDLDLQNKVRDCVVSLSPVSVSSAKDDLVCVSGIIENVDEKSALSWAECDGCGSDRLTSDSITGKLECLHCNNVVVSPISKKKMEVTVHTDQDSSLKVSISLQQFMIERLLPEKEDEEGYDVNCLLQKHLGPVNCVITSVSHDARNVQLSAVELPM